MESNFRVGQYVLERPLGEGGMAEVWLGRNIHLGTYAAVKFLSQAYAGVAEIEQRFLNEGRRQGSLNHPNIIKVFGFEYVENRSFLILQFIEGESLEDLLRRSGRLQPAEASKIAISVCGALDCAHEHSIVHRDIKPSNILLDENRTPYLGDFGIVLATNEKRVTRTGTAMGTALYMSPEQIKEPSSVDRRSDIYSLGCVLFEMFAGEPPFNPASDGQGDTDFTIKLAHVQQAPPPLRRKNPALSIEIEAVVMRCLAKNPVERYATCRELRDALSAAMVGRSAIATTQRQTPVPLPAPTAYPGPVVRPGPVTPVPVNRGTPIPVPPPVVPWVAPPPVYPVQPSPMTAIQYCPNCRRPIATGLFQCPFCSIRLPAGFGVIPAIGPGNLGRSASSSRTCGILSLIVTGVARIIGTSMNSYDLNHGGGAFLGILGLAGIVLAIVAIVKGHGAKRVLAHFAPSPLRGVATAGIVMGWVTIGFVAVLIVIAASAQN